MMIMNIFLKNNNNNINRMNRSIIEKEMENNFRFVSKQQVEIIFKYLIKFNHIQLFNNKFRTLFFVIHKQFKLGFDILKNGIAKIPTGKLSYT